MVIGVFLAFMFVISYAAHMLYVKGHAFDVARAMHGAHNMSIYSTQEECESVHEGGCVLQLCDNIPAGKEFEDVCGEGYKEGWQPKKHGGVH